ncbi:hypothetical protein [Holdemanella porci]|jgi:hypothetical protein|uniref:hypothetical protein n=1 Tax=Holdemanella porci TaxID=2652276 RepID=UPI003FD81393
MNGYQPKIDRSKIKVPEYLKKNKEPEYEYKVTMDDRYYKEDVEDYLNNGWSIFEVINHLIIFRKEKDVKEIQD